VRWRAAAKADGITLKCSKRDLAVPGRHREIDRLFGFSSSPPRMRADIYIYIYDMMATKGRKDENNVFGGIHVRVCETTPPPRIVLTK